MIGLRPINMTQRTGGQVTADSVAKIAGKTLAWRVLQRGKEFGQQLLSLLFAVGRPRPVHPDELWSFPERYIVTDFQIFCTFRYESASSLLIAAMVKTEMPSY